MGRNTDYCDAADRALEVLSDEYAEWLGAEGIPGRLGADELLAVSWCELTTAQTDWLRDFCKRWDTAQAEADYHWAIYARGEE